MKEKIGWIYKIIILLVSAIGIYLNFELFTVKGALVYYTVQSNLFCFIFYFTIIFLKLINKFKKNMIYYVSKGIMTMAIAVTMIVYQLFLSNSGSYAGHEITSAVVHLVVPLLVIFDYFIFGEKGNLKKWHPYAWTLSLIFYLIFDVVYISLGGKFNNLNNYPYFFLNFAKYGVSGVIINCLAIYVIFLIFGMFVQVIDQKLKVK